MINNLHHLPGKNVLQPYVVVDMTLWDPKSFDVSDHRDNREERLETARIANLRKGVHRDLRGMVRLLAPSGCHGFNMKQ